MKPAPFAYLDPQTVDEATAALSAHGMDAKVLAGGQSLMPLLNMRLARPAVIVDLNRVEGLDYIRESNGSIAIGAMTRQRSIERSELVRTKQPLLLAATQYIAHPQIRNRGTVGGSLAHADPAAEYPAVAMALDAEFDIIGPRGRRTATAKDFFVTYLTTCLDAADVLVEVRFPVQPERTSWSFLEVSRRHGDFALAGVAATLTLDGNGACADARIAMFGVGPTAVRASEAEALLRGRRPADELFEEAGSVAVSALDEPLSDIHASADFRRQLAGVLTRRALAEAASRAGGS